MKDMFYDINETTNTGFLKYNKGALINTGYSLAKRDNKDYLIIMNPNLLYSSHLHNKIIHYPNKVHLLGRYKNTVQDIMKYEMDIMSIKVSDFEKINGFPNDIWDPILVDKIVINRLHTNNIKKLYINNIKQPSGEDNFVVINDQTYDHSIDNRRYEDFAYSDSFSSKYSGIEQEKYSVINYKEEIDTNISAAVNTT